MPPDAKGYGATDHSRPQGLDDSVEEEPEDENREHWTEMSSLSARSSHVNFQYLVALLCTATISEGYDLGVMNAAIVQIQEDFGFDSSQVGLIIAITPAATFFGALAQGALADAYGRRMGLLSAIAFLFTGPLIMAFSSDIVGLVLGRGLCGFGIGGGLLVVTIYIAEIAPAGKRGQLVACQEVALNFGMVLGFLMGWVLVGTKHDWRWMLMLGSLLPMPLIVSLLAIYATGATDTAFLPETPRWLTQRKRFESAALVLERFMGSVEATMKMEELREECENAKEDFISWSEILCAWGNGPLMRMLLTGILVAVGEMICGGPSIGYYSNLVLTPSMGKSAAFFATLLIGVVRFIGVVLATFLMDDAGRKTLLMSSALVMTVACVWVAWTARYHVGEVWMLPAGLCLMMLGFVMGLGSVSLVYISEIFPTRIRQKGMVICMFWCRVGGASSALMYPILIEDHGIPTTFVLQAGINFVLFCLIWLTVRETTGLSLEEAYKLFDVDVLDSHKSAKLSDKP